MLISSKKHFVKFINATLENDISKSFQYLNRDITNRNI